MAYQDTTEAFVKSLAGDENLIQEIISQNLTSHGMFYDLLHTRRLVRHFADALGFSLNDKALLEIGASRQPCLPFILLLEGARQYVASNVLPVESSLPMGTIDTIALLASGFCGADLRKLSLLLRAGKDDTGRATGILNKPFYISYSPKPAEEINLPDGSMDFIFSIAVLEHVRNVKDAIANCRRMLSKDGLTIHLIDLRDHGNFAHPLGHLELDEAAFERAVHGTAKQQNRLRASDYIPLFEENGLAVERIWLRDKNPPLLTPTATSLTELVKNPVACLFPRQSFDEITPWVTETMRRGFDVPFSGKDVRDLSVVGMVIAARPK